MQCANALAHFDHGQPVLLPEFEGEMQQDEARASRIANMFRFLCPSAWLPGKQRWGAF